MLVRWRDLDESDVRHHTTVLDQARNFKQGNRDVIGPALVHQIADVASNEEAPVAKPGVGFPLNMSHRSGGQEVKKLDVSRGW